MARYFNGTTGLVNYQLDNAQKDLGTYSFSVHVYRISPGAWGYGFVYRKQASGSTRSSFYNDNGNVGWGLTLEQFFSGDTGRWSVDYPANNEWNVYTWTYDSTSTSNDPICYKNGTSVTVTERGTPSGTVLTGETQITLGNVAGTGGEWDGYLAEYGLWNRVLTSSEAALLGKGYSPLFIPNGLVMHTPLFGNYSTEPDLIKGVAGSITDTSKVPHPRVIYPTIAQIRKFASTSTASHKFLTLLGVS